MLDRDLPLLLRPRLLQPLPKAFHTAAAGINLLLTGVNGMAATADFNLDRFHRARDPIDRTACTARGGGVFEDLRVDAFFHKTCGL